jgi:polyferredoxin
MSILYDLIAVPRLRNWIEYAVVAFLILTVVFALLEAERRIRIVKRRIKTAWRKHEFKKVSIMLLLLLIAFGPGGHYLIEVILEILNG